MPNVCKPQRLGFTQKCSDTLPLCFLLLDRSLQVSVFSGLCRSGAYYHVSLGHATAMATVTFFGAEELKNGWRALIEADTKNSHSLVAEGWEEVWSLDDMASLPFPWGAEFAQQSELLGQARVNSEGSVALGRGQSEGHASPLQYCLLQFHSPVITPPSSVVLGSRLDSMASGAGSGSTHADSSDYLAGAGEANCRIAFYGRLVGGAVDDGSKRRTPSDADGGLGFGTEAGQLKLFNEKVKTGCVFRVGGGSGTAERGVGEGSTLEVYGKDLFKKETNMSPFVGMLVQTEVRSMSCSCAPHCGTTAHSTAQLGVRIGGVLASEVCSGCSTTFLPP